jgi:hypothetical protein
MHFLSHLWHAVWILRVALDVLLVVVLVRKRLHEQFPVFFLYIAWSSIVSITLVGMDYLATGEQYYYAFYCGAIGNAALSFGVIYELFRHLLRDYPVLGSTGHSLYRWSALVFIAIAFALVWSAPAAGAGTLMATYFVLSRTVRLLQCGMLIFLFIFARSFGLSWKNRAFGIALGFGIVATSTLFIAAIRAQIQPATKTLTTDVLQLISQVSDVIAVGTWITYALAEDRTLIPPSGNFPDGDLQDWNREVRKLLP